MGGQPARSGLYSGNGFLTPHAGLGSDISLPAKLEKMLPETQLLRTWPGKELSSLQMESPLRTNREARTANLVCARYIGVLGLCQHCFPSLSLRPHGPAPPRPAGSPLALPPATPFGWKPSQGRLCASLALRPSGPLDRRPLSPSPHPLHTHLGSGSPLRRGRRWGWFSLSQQPPPRISPRPGLRAELGRGRAVPQTSRLVVRRCNLALCSCRGPCISKNQPSGTRYSGTPGDAKSCVAGVLAASTRTQRRLPSLLRWVRPAVGVRGVL